MGHPATLLVQAGVTTRTAYPESCLAHPSASNRPCRPTPTRTSAASLRVQLSCSFRPNHGDLTCFYGLDPCGFRCHYPIPSLASSGSPAPRTRILRHPSLSGCTYRLHYDGRVATSLIRRPPYSLSSAQLVAPPTFLAHSRRVYRISLPFRTLSKFIGRPHNYFLPILE